MARREISERCYLSDQSWNYEWTGQIGGYKFQVRIRRNAYDPQSYARVFIWNFTSVQWNQIVDVPIGECACRNISYIHQHCPADAFHLDRDRLLKQAVDIATVPPEFENIVPIEDDGRTAKHHQV